MAGHVTISRQMQQRMSPFILFVWVLTCAIWSTVWLFIKLGVRDVPPAAFAVYRMAIALAVLVPVISLRRTPWPRGRSEWTLVLGTGFILLGVNYALLNWGIQYISSGLTAVLQAMTPVFGFVFAHVLLHDERMTPLKGLALTLGVAGVGIIFWDQMAAGGTRPVLGCVAVTAGAACVAVAYVVMKRRGAARTQCDPHGSAAGRRRSPGCLQPDRRGQSVRLPLDWNRGAFGTVSRVAGFAGRRVAELLAAETDWSNEAPEHGIDRAPDRGPPRSPLSR
jgi:multidrug transporter EmrE-like cation transporter